MSIVPEQSLSKKQNSQKEKTPEPWKIKPKLPPIKDARNNEECLSQDASAANLNRNQSLCVVNGIELISPMGVSNGSLKSTVKILNNSSAASIRDNSKWKSKQQKEENEKDPINEDDSSRHELSVSVLRSDYSSKLSSKSLQSHSSKQSQHQNEKHDSSSRGQDQNITALSSILANKIRSLLSSIPFQIFITILTVCSLFMEDMRTIFVEKEDNHAIDYVNILFLSTFTIEILLSLTVDDYAFSFFFYLDVISTVSICMDITMITDVIYDSGGSSQQLNLLITQSKASRAAARAVRIMKIFRLARVVKLYKSAIKTKELNQKKQKQLLMQKLKAKKLKKNTSSNFMNENFEGDTSEYKFSVNHNSMASRNELTDNSNSKKKQFSSLSNTLAIDPGNMEKTSNLQPFVKIKEESINQEDSVKQHQQSRNGAAITNSEGNSSLDSKQMGLNEADGDESKNGNLPGKSPIEINRQQSNISKILSDSTIKKIIIVILIIMLSITALDIKNYYPESTSWDFLTDYVAELLLRPDVSTDFINQMIEHKLTYIAAELDVNSEVIAIETPFNEIFSIETVEFSSLHITEIGLSETQIDIDAVLALRPELTLKEDSSTGSGSADSDAASSLTSFNYVTVILSYKEFNAIDSWFSIGKIIFICLTIIYLLQSFNTNISNLIVTPIEKMLEIVVNPDKKLQEKEEEEQEQESEFRQARYETTIVQKAIIKIRGLMSTVFGRIGMDLLYGQLFQQEDIKVSNYLQTTNKSFCIYAICKIHNLIEIVQTLKMDSFSFVNEIGHILHSAAFRYGGCGVKNLSDGFLIVFKMPPEKQKQIMESHMKAKVAKNKHNTYLNIMCDYSVYSLVKTLVRLQKQPQLLKFKKDQRILQKFGNNFSMELNFALGVGQSIEGIAGSEFKVDPIYLGGKLNDLEKISVVSRKYPNLIIMEKEIYNNLTMGLQSHCRVMDLVKLNEYEEGNTELYAVDLDLQYISPSRSKAEKYKRKEDQPDIHLKKQLNMECLKDDIEINNYSAQNFIGEKKELKEVFKKILSDDNKQKYSMAFQLYKTGEWQEAKYLLEDIMRVTKEDVLTKRLYNYMAGFAWKCPGGEGVLNGVGYKDYRDV